MHPACLLCESPKVRVADALSQDQLLALWRDLNFDLPAPLARCLGKVARVECYRCETCGFEFFDPSLAGDGDFYGALFSQASNTYYSPIRPENAWAVEIIQRGTRGRVLDVGCGSGAFLEYARQAGLEVAGMEFSASAAAAARSKGFLISEKLLTESTPADYGGALDWITLFQVLEHVPDPIAMVRAAMGLLKPGGGLLIAVPMERSVAAWLAPYDPHRWPPHHVTWWTKQAFRTLAARTGLELRECTGAVLERGVATYFAGLGIRERKILRPSAPGLPRQFGRLAGLIFAVLTLNYRLKLRLGHSLFAHLQKPV